MKKYLEKINGTKPYSQQLIFVLCCVFLFGLPLMQKPPTFLIRTLISLIIIFALVSLEKVSVRILVIGFFILIIGWIAKVSENLILEYITEFTTNLFLFWMVGSNVHRIIHLKQVFLNNLFEAVNGFLLMTIAFASFAFFLNKHFPASFISNQNIFVAGDMIYFSIITLTTTGYGDILPFTPAAKDLAAVMAVCGQLYIAIIMAVMVGKFSNRN